MHRIIFICSGNLCRSIMAEALFHHEAEGQGLRAIATSMGTLMMEGRRPPDEVLRVMDEIGIDLASRRSQGLRPAILRRADRLYVMDPTHVAHLRSVDSALSPSPLGLLAPPTSTGPFRDPTWIADPMGHHLEVFRACRERIHICIQALVDELQKGSAPSGGRSSIQPPASRTSHRDKE